MSIDYRFGGALAAASLAGLLLAPGNAPAQQERVELTGVIEEIVVTARKREETLQDVPFSINAQTEDYLRRTGATDLEDVANNVGGLTVQNLGPGQSQVAIRGISAGQIVRDQPGVKEQVGIYLDESVISLSLFTPDLELFDLNRVEVLRGPQGTLFGSGSLSGTIRYITNQPDFETFSFTGESTANFIDDGEFGGDVKATVNVPISDTVALRATGYYKSFAGYIDAVQPTGVDEDVNSGDRVGARVALAFQPNEAFRITPRLVVQNVDIDGFNRIDIFNILANPFTTTRTPVTLGEREQFTQLQEKFEDDFTLVDVTLDYDFGPVTLTSISSWTDRDVLVLRDSTQLTASITAQPDILDQPEPVFTIDAPLSDVTEVEMITEEIRLSSNYEGRIEWVLGAFYSDIEREYGQSLDVAGFEAATGIPTAGQLAGTDILFFSLIPYEFTQLAFFGEGTYSITDRFDLTLGLRWFDFEEERVLNFDGIFADTTIGLPGETESDGVSPRIMVSYAVNDDVTFNAQAAKGFRLGGINDPLNEPLCSQEDLDTFGDRPTFQDEELWNYEVGVKSTFAQGRGTLNVAAFFADIQDLQATIDAGTCSSRIVFNVPDARSIGAELELSMQVNENFDFAISTSFTDAELESTITSVDDTGAVSVVAGIEDGNRLPTTPDFQFFASGTYSWPLRSEWEGFVTASFQHVGDRITQIGDQAAGFDTVNLQITPIGDPSVQTFTFDPELPSYQIGNIRVGARNDMWEVALFVNNVTDEVAFLALDRERGGRARVGYLTNEPRTFGVTARLNF